MIEDRSGILYRSWRVSSPKAVLLLVHGLGAHSGKWEFLSDFFLHQEISSYAVELRGFGEAVASKDRPSSFRAYFHDITCLYKIVKEENSLKNIFIAGESMGAVISFLMAAKEPGLFKGLIAMSPALKSSLKLGMSDYFNIFFNAFYNPRRNIAMPFTFEMCTRDADYLKRSEKEKHEAPQAASRLLFDTAIAQIRCRILKDRFKIPLLFLVPGDDKITDSRASIAFFNSLKLNDKTLIEYPDMYHSISIDLGREKVFGDILEWMKARI